MLNITGVDRGSLPTLCDEGKEKWNMMNYAKLNDSDFNSVFGPHAFNPYSTGKWPTAMDTYMNTIPNEKNSNNWPYPLVRNHIYRFTLTNTKAGDNEESLGVTSNVIASPTIDFSERVRSLDISNLRPTQTSPSPKR